MDNKKRLEILNEYNIKNESMENNLKKGLEFSEDRELYKFLIENDYVVLFDPLDNDSKIFILRKNEYFILKHLYNDEKSPFGINELCYIFDFEKYEIEKWLNNLVEKKLIEKTKEIEGEIYYRCPGIGTVRLVHEISRYMEMQYYLVLSKVRNKKLIKKDDNLNKELVLTKRKLRYKGYIESLLLVAVIILLLFLIKISIFIKMGMFCFIIFIYLKVNYKYGKEIIIIETKLKEIESEIELEKLTSANHEKRAEQLFRINQFELSQYYNEILKQSKTIFKWGIVCIVLGMALIVLSVLIIGFSNKIGIKFGIEIGIKQSQIIAIISAIGGLFSNIVAGFYMNMYNKTMKSLDSFHQRFVGTHHLHFGNLLVSKIEDIKLREEAYASIFKDMIVPEEHKDLE